MWTLVSRRMVRGAGHHRNALSTPTISSFYSLSSSTPTPVSTPASTPATPATPTASCRILCVDVPPTVADTACVQELVQRGHVVDQIQSTSTGSSLVDVIDDYDALLVSPATRIPSEALARGARAQLKLVAVASGVIDSACVDVMEATSQGVLLLQLDKKQASDRFSVEAELALSQLIQLARHIPASTRATKMQHATTTTTTTTATPRESFTGTELHGKTLGLIGLGRAGKCVAEMAAALGLQVCGYDPNLSHEAAAQLGVKRVSLAELYASADFISFHAPLTARTRGMFDDAALAQCRPGVRIVSVAEYRGRRSGLLRDETLLKGLESGQIAGLALDVLDDEALDHAGSEANVPDSAGSGSGSQTAAVDALWAQLVAHDRVLVTRHSEGKVSQAVSDAKRYRALAENVGDALAGRYYRGVANGVFMPLTLEREMQPFLALGHALGRLVFHLSVSSNPRDKIARVNVASHGRSGPQIDLTAPQPRAALQGAVVQGLLDCIASVRGTRGFGDAAQISLLNASLLAMTSGMDVRAGELSLPSGHGHWNNSLTVELVTRGGQSFLVTGSVFGDEPRVVGLNGYTDFPAFRPEGNLLIFRNEDKPGAIAGILRELTQAQLNIAHLGLSRRAGLELALGILTLDEAPDEETITRLRALENVESVQFAHV